MTMNSLFRVGTGWYIAILSVLLCVITGTDAAGGSGRGGAAKAGVPRVGAQKFSASEAHASGTAAGGLSLADPPEVSRRVLNIGGFIVNVYGLEYLAPIVDDTTPNITLLIHMHGRTRSAMMEEPLVKTYFAEVRSHITADPAGSKNDFLIASFDGPNHGNRTTLPMAQNGFSKGNLQFLMDQYAMIGTQGILTSVGDAYDASFLADFLPFYLFPMGERTITDFVVSGKSMGGHATYHVGTPLIGTPDYVKLVESRTSESNITMASPFVPLSFMEYVNKTNPANMAYTSVDASINPFYGKKLFAGSGGTDPLVLFNYSSEFLSNVVLGPDTNETRESLQIYLQPNTTHQVTNESTSPTH
ncbi:hypothetical protein MYAM1_001925 [Malassezia yamatoensis]|uniref:Uncharacterized protein n=1 Tax=Malassezia yamatoensis TaxID=253288 RepID=A0AAJ5YSW4_9BASI|nr:hypothetical protein MYAM1_001925 [Malassezia yamatoensis]